MSDGEWGKGGVHVRQTWGSVGRPERVSKERGVPWARDRSDGVRPLGPEAPGPQGPVGKLAGSLREPIKTTETSSFAVAGSVV